MDERQRQELLRNAESAVQFDCPMDKWTTFRVGGAAEALCKIGEMRLLQQVLSYLSREHIPYMAVGNGSNLLVRDTGFKGVMIHLSGRLALIEQDGKNGERLMCGGGLTITRLLAHCKQQGLGGLEFLAGIPGTVGGAVSMNAGAWRQDVGSHVQEIQLATAEGECLTWGPERLKFSYRALSLPEGAVVAKAGFHLKKDRPETVAAKMAEYLRIRLEKQPLGIPSAGSVFKNPPGDYAGRLIESVGLKGKRIGGAMISPKHANFIVNTGGARAEDILALMELAQKKVQEQTGIGLEPEIRVVG